ncbi:MAG: hypothetical protein IJ906_07215 [Oscillospiraceae bacterium]|nr:hypothetical protein [Oscillospiraceae bacterium]
MEDKKLAKRVGLEMNILMSVSMSLCLALTGLLSSGQFTLPGFIESFLISLIISFLLGIFVSVPRINTAVEQKFRLKRGSMTARAAESLVSDLVYTPVMSVIMITLAWITARAHGANPPYLMMLLKGLGLSLLTAFLLIFLFEPLFLRMVLKHNGIPLDMEKPSEDPDDGEI